MSLARPTRRVPELYVEQLALGELDPERAREIRTRLEREVELGRLEALVYANARGEPLAEGLALELERARARVDARGRARAHGWSLSVAAASFAVMALVVGVSGLPATPNEAVRGKGGGAGLVVYRAVGGGYEALPETAHVHPGDVLQLAVRPGRAREVAVYSIDANGAATEHLAPTQVARAGELRLPSAFRLDDSPGFERFFLVLGDRLDTAVVQAALARLASDPEHAPLTVAGARVVARTI